MQVDRMFSAGDCNYNQAKQKRRGGHLFNERVIVHCLAKTATLQHSFKSNAINGRAKGDKKRETTDVQMRKGEKR